MYRVLVRKVEKRDNCNKNSGEESKTTLYNVKSNEYLNQSNKQHILKS